MKDRRIAWMAGALVILGLTALGGCSKKPPPGEILPPPGAAAGAEPTTPTGEEAGAGARLPGQAVAEQQVRLADVFFEFDRFRLTDEARTHLARNGAVLIENPQLRLLIEGHCDERGTREYNLALGDKRAQTAREFLVSYGIDPGRVETVSFGEERPFAVGHDDACWAQNRRAHFVLVD